MKSVISWILILSSISFMIIGLKYLSWTHTIEAAIIEQIQKPAQIIYEYDTDKGTIVFYQQVEGQDLSIAFVRESFGRYKVAYSGVTGEVEKSRGLVGFTTAYYPNIEGVFFPVYLGLITNPEITRLTLSDAKEKMTKEVTIIETDTNRIWLVDMSEFKEIPSEVLISAYSSDNELIIRQNEHIY